MNEITAAQNVAVADFKETAIEYLNGMGMKLPQKYANQFIELCKAYSLNPFKRECYAVGYGDKFNIITGYEVYIKRAERTGKLDGWKVEVKGSMPSMTATITIYRKDWKMPFEHTVLFSEVKQNSPIWQKQPTFMLKKVAIAQGFRLCFPDELGGMPYTSDELAEVERPAERNITNEATAVYSEPVHEPVQNEPSEPSVDDISVRFNSLLKTHGDKLGAHYDKAVEAFQTGSDSEMVSMYNRCVSYLERKGVKVA